MNELKAPSLQSLLDSERGSTDDSLLAESLQLDFEDLDDVEYSIPPTYALPTLETVLSEFDSDIASELGVPAPSIAEDGSGVRSGGAGGSGSIMRYTLLQGISAQISSAADRINAGLASACAISAYISIGTSHGHILTFDVTQTLRWAHQDKNSNGAVASLAFNADCTRLLAGYARGLIVMLDSQSGDVLRQIFDAITPNSGILHVKWTSRPALALVADSGGSVWSLSFTRKLGIRGCSSRCLFSGARGEVCAVEPLIMDTHGQHELDQYCIVALATLSKYFIVTVRPRLKVIKYHSLTGPGDCLPVLAWQMVLIQAVDTSRSVDPVIVVGRGNQLFFHQLFMSNGRITLLYLRHVQLQSNLLSVHWLGPKCVGCMDTSEILYLYDVRSSKELECLDMANAGLVYNSAQFKGLATGGNVSPALALAGTHACYNSIAANGTQLYILSARALHMIGVRTWSERISFLVKNQRWQEACDLALEGYRVAADRPKRRLQAKERILMLFKEYLSASSRAPEYCLGTIIECLIAVGELELLWSQLWDRLHNTDLFLQHISDHIENEQIKRVSPVISQALVDYWLMMSPKKLEDLILKLDWTCLDLNQALKAAKRHKLYRAQMYLNTHALNDYTVSLTELIPNLLEYESANLGNCLLVYISSCLAGRSYPTGDIPADLVQNVKHEVLRCLTSLHSNASEPNEMPYPYLRALLKFDTRETLNVLSLAFQEKEFSGELGFSHRKRIINILLEIMTPENATWAEIGCLLNFIAQQISQQCLPRDAQLLEKVLNYLSKESIANESARQHSERESAWHELLVNNCLENVSNDEEQLELAKRAHCHYVQEYLLEKLHRYDTILECYLPNPLRHDTMFVYVERHINNPERKIYEQLKLHLKKILEINPEETTRIVHIYYKDKIDELHKSLCDSEWVLFIFLKNLHKRRAPLSTEQCEDLLELLCKHPCPKGVTENEVENNHNTNRDMKKIDVQKYVLEFLKEPESNYRSDKALEIVNHYKFNKAAIYLYEKQEDYHTAFDLAMRELRANDLDKTGSISEIETKVALCAQEVCDFCIRASRKLKIKDCEPFWFELLQFILQRENLKSITKKMLHEASQHVELTNLIQLILNMRNVAGLSYGDIKELLMSMLNNARNETKTMESALEVFLADLHTQFAKSQREACRGIWITTMRCVTCQNRLYNQDSIIVLGKCGHPMHEECAVKLKNDINCNNKPKSMDMLELESADSKHNGGDLIMFDENADEKSLYNCTRCGLEYSDKNVFNKPMQLSQPSRYLSTPFDTDYSKSFTSSITTASTKNLGSLSLKAPPRKLM